MSNSAFNVLQCFNVNTRNKLKSVLIELNPWDVKVPEIIETQGYLILKEVVTVYILYFKTQNSYET